MTCVVCDYIISKCKHCSQVEMFSTYEGEAKMKWATWEDIRIVSVDALNTKRGSLPCASKWKNMSTVLKEISRDSVPSIYFLILQLDLLCTTPKGLWSTLQWNPQLRQPCFLNICQTTRHNILCVQWFDKRTKCSTSRKINLILILIC